ncbi:hypothetical protein H312_02117, partial [Anncaliia algerae PRA339]
MSKKIKKIKEVSSEEESSTETTDSSSSESTNKEKENEVVKDNTFALFSTLFFLVSLFFFMGTVFFLTKYVCESRHAKVLYSKLKNFDNTSDRYQTDIYKLSKIKNFTVNFDNLSSRKSIVELKLINPSHTIFYLIYNGHKLKRIYLKDIIHYLCENSQSLNKDVISTLFRFFYLSLHVKHTKPFVIFCSNKGITINNKNYMSYDKSVMNVIHAILESAK